MNDDARLDIPSGISTGLNNPVEIDRDGVGITRGLDLGCRRLNGSGVMDRSHGGCLGLYQKALLGIRLVEDFIICGQADHPLGGRERPFVANLVGNEGDVSGLGVDGAKVLD